MFKKQITQLKKWWKKLFNKKPKTKTFTIDPKDVSMFTQRKTISGIPWSRLNSDREKALRKRRNRKMRKIQHESRRINRKAA